MTSVTSRTRRRRSATAPIVEPLGRHRHVDHALAIVSLVVLRTMCIVGAKAASDTHAARTRARRMNCGGDVTRVAAAETEGRATAAVHQSNEFARVAAAAGVEAISHGTSSVTTIETESATAVKRTAAMSKLNSPPDRSASSATLLAETWMHPITLKQVRRRLHAVPEVEVAAEVLIGLAAATTEIERVIVTRTGTTGRDRVVAGRSRTAAAPAAHVAIVARVT